MPWIGHLPPPIARRTGRHTFNRKGRHLLTIHLGIVGCGDVAFRTYFPGLGPDVKAGRARVAVCFDPVRERADRAAAEFPGAVAVTSLDDLVAHDGLDAAVNLTPAPMHREITAQLLEADLDVYSEKPLAATVAEAQELTALAERRGKLLLVAPAVMATNRWRWLKRVVEAGKIGRPTLVTAQMANMGPAGWRGYTGDPKVFYGEGVGPLIDTAVYVLHAATGILGPVRRLQAVGGIVIPKRTILIDRLLGQTVDVTTPDQILVHLDFGDDVFAQILSSFAVPRSKAPAVELHGTGGSVSIALPDWYDANGPVDLLVRDESPLGVEGWQTVGPPAPSPHTNLVGCGVPHLVSVLLGEERPILTAQHATHVLDVMLTTFRAIESGETVELSTSF